MKTRKPREDEMTRRARRFDVDDYIQQCADNYHLPVDLLELAVGRDLRKSLKTARGVFNMSASLDMRGQASDIIHWLVIEYRREAPWLKKCDAQGRPLKLLNKNIAHLYNAIKKHKDRHSKKTDFAGKRFYHIDEPSRAMLLEHGGLSADQTYDMLCQDLTPGTFIEILANKQNVNIFNITLTHLKDKRTRINRYVNLEEKTAGSMGAGVGQNGRGFGSQSNHNFVTLYEQLGIQNITLMAGSIGTYAWSGMGYLPNQESWNKLRPAIRERLDYLQQNPPPEGPLPARVVERVTHALDSLDPKSFWVITDEKTPCHGYALGKVLTLETADLGGRLDNMKPSSIGWWAGSLDLNDPDCRDRAKASTKKTTPLPPLPAAKGVIYGRK